MPRTFLAALGRPWEPGIPFVVGQYLAPDGRSGWTVKANLWVALVTGGNCSVAGTGPRALTFWSRAVSFSPFTWGNMHPRGSRHQVMLAA